MVNSNTALITQNINYIFWDQLKTAKHVSEILTDLKAICQTNLSEQTIKQALLQFLFPVRFS